MKQNRHNDPFAPSGKEPRGQNMRGRAPNNRRPTPNVPRQAAGRSPGFSRGASGNPVPPTPGRPPSRRPAPPPRRSMSHDTPPVANSHNGPTTSRRRSGAPRREQNLPVVATNKSVTRKAKKSGNKKSGIPRWVLVMLDLILVAIVAYALYLIIKPIMVQRDQEDMKDKVLKLMERENKSVTVDITKEFGKVQGERYEDFGENFVQPEEDDTEEVSLTYSGRLVINKIGVVTPVGEPETYSESLYTLRFGVSIQENLARLDEPGLTAIFGHRFLTDGRDFNRLDEIVEGDSFYIDYLPHGKRYYYDVTEQLIIPKDDLRNYLFDYYEENVVVLVTCHPPVYGEQTERLLIFAKPNLDKTEDLPQK